MLNRSQALVLGFFFLALASLVVILAVAREVFDQACACPVATVASRNSPSWPCLRCLSLCCAWVLSAVGAGRFGLSWSLSSRACCACQRQSWSSPASCLRLARPGTYCCRSYLASLSFGIGDACGLPWFASSVGSSLKQASSVGLLLAICHDVHIHVAR
jgi:hypothetical protein